MVKNMPYEEKPTNTCFVYDKRTGKVVHIHQFIAADPDGKCSKEEMEKSALSLAPTRCNRAHLGVVHLDEADQRLNPEFIYRVDLNTQKLIRERAPARQPGELQTEPITKEQRVNLVGSMLVTSQAMEHLRKMGMITPQADGSNPLRRADGCCKPDAGTCCPYAKPV